MIEDVMNRITNIARNLRKNSTEAECILWRELKSRKLGYKFVRQKPILFTYNKRNKFFVADFYCKQLKLVIELDGSIHDKQKDHDQLRTEIMNTIGIKVIRFTNEEIMNDMDNVLKTIIYELRPSQEVGNLFTEQVDSMESFSVYGEGCSKSRVRPRRRQREA